MSRGIPLSLLEKTKLPFGKHKGKSFDQTPLKYLDWLIGQAWFKQKFQELADRLGEYLTHPTIARELEAELQDDEDDEFTASRS